VVDVHLVVLGAGGNKVLTGTAKATVDGVEPLRDSDKLSNQTFLLDVPQVDTLSGNVDQGVTVALVQGEGHYSVILLYAKIDSFKKATSKGPRHTRHF